ncbi:MAG TPA: anti-sigma factor antagonist [Phycisphaerales bacterium]|nr:anti-sigma factor antagonist [Phycisphaerales bacterium]|tara:strand:+ start:338 stop:697 length:360 start_codon:yes stop_codon:yes gene_type:complete
MAEGESRLTIENSEQVIRIGFLDRNILEEAAIQNIGDQVADLIDTTPNPKLLMDFADVDHLSSAALGMLITINNRVRAKGGQLRLATIDPQIYEVFAITKLNKLFNICDTAEQAMSSFK